MVMPVDRPWAPLAPSAVTSLLGAFDRPWWFAGGHALELAVGSAWREHSDIDVGIRRCDAPLLHRAFVDVEASVAAAGVLTPWTGRPLDPARDENNVWVGDGATWMLDVLVGDGDDEAWVYRRDPTLRLGWDRALDTDGDVAWLTPALQLLFKSARPRPKDQLDAEAVIPTLDAWATSLLTVRLRGGHDWEPLISPHHLGCSAGDVLEVLDVLHAARIDVWVDGGWGVDALLREQTRRHADLDLALPTRQWARATAALADRGWSLVRNDGPYNAVHLDPSGRLVDLHAFDDTTTVIGDDGVERHGPNGLAYEAGGFTGRGTVAGVEVRCTSAGFQVRSHTGYAVDADDWHDVALLADRFDLPIPDDYDSFRS